MNKKLVNVIGNALVTALIGLFAGLGLSLVIWGILDGIATGNEMPPRELIAFFGMGAGTVLGAIFGGIVGLKEK